MKTFTEKRFYEWHEDSVSVTLRAMSGSYGGGSEVLVIQKVTGTLSPGAHAGSYNGQDAYNDLLVVDGKNIHNTQTVFSHSGAGELCGEPNGKRLQRPTNNYQDGGVHGNG